ncbi:MAG: hypothetical protein JW760_14690 [Spirochaetales bacterium]|nr:hypothetical protein [Spirochaetales bacterium]
MGAYFEQLDSKVADHIKGLRQSIKVADDDEALEILAKGWKEKEDAFIHQLSTRNMEAVEEFNPEDESGGLLLLTYSGSLLNIGPMDGGKRKASYASIGMREDVPKFAESDDAVVEGPIKLGEGVKFSKGPIKSSSPIYMIAVVVEDLEAVEEEELLSEVTQILAEDFTEVNRTIISGE